MKNVKIDIYRNIIKGDFMKKYIIVIDQGTTSSRVLLINKYAEIIYNDYIELNMDHKPNGELTQNPNEILSSVNKLINRTFKNNNIKPEEVSGIGITNQRETTIIWDKTTNKPISDAISWQAHHTSYITDEWIKLGYINVVKEKTGLLINPYFSASKIKHILNKYEGKIDNLMFGTIDSFILYNLSVEKAFKTDVSNASRTMLYNINTMQWDDELLKLFKIPKTILPKVFPNNHLFGHYQYEDTLIPIVSMIGDQQSALFGHLCLDEGETKVTYGTGCFILTNTNNKNVQSNKGLISTVYYQFENELPNYAIEGSVFTGGSAISWMRDKLNLINYAHETEQMAFESSNNNVYVIPAFVGLGAPYWDNEVKGAILGLEANTTKADIMKATLNSIAYQVTDILKVIENDHNINIKSIRVDGGASNNNYLMQFQADLINAEIIQNKESEITGLGTAFIAGLKTKFWDNVEDIKRLTKIKKVFAPKSKSEEIKKLYDKWQKAINSVRTFK